MKFSRTRERFAIGALIVAAVMGGLLWRQPSTGSFFAVLEQHPTLCRLVRPAFWLMSGENYFDIEILNAESERRAVDGEDPPFLPFFEDLQPKRPLSGR